MLPNIFRICSKTYFVIYAIKPNFSKTTWRSSVTRPQTRAPLERPDPPIFLQRTHRFALIFTDNNARKVNPFPRASASTASAFSRFGFAVPRTALRGRSFSRDEDEYLTMRLAKLELRIFGSPLNRTRTHSPHLFPSESSRKVNPFFAQMGASS